MHELTDAQLIQMTRAGNRDAFGILFERYLSMAQNIAQGILHDRAIAEDVAQDAMLQAYLGLDNLKEPAHYSSWLHGIVRNLCHNHLRRHARGTTIVVDAMDDWRVEELNLLPSQQNGEVPLCGDPAKYLEQQTLQKSIRHALAQLPIKRQEAASLFYLEQLSIREIAQKLNASETAIKSRLFQARKQLRTQLALLQPELYQPFVPPRSNSNRKTRMIKIDSVHTFTRDDNHAILLFVAKDKMRCLQMWIGADMGYALEKIIMGEEMARPLTHNTMAKMIELLDAQLTHVEVNAIKETTFIGTIHLEVNGISKQLDARPSDAVPLALVTGSPIYIADEVIKRNGRDLPDPFDEGEWLETVKLQHQERVELLKKWQEALSADGSKFTVRARNACTIMMAEAEQYGHNYLGTEHLLLGLVAEKEGLAGKVLGELGVTYDVLEQLMMDNVGKEEHKSTQLPVLAPRLTVVFELAEAERAQRGHTYIGSEHLLLGLLNELDSDGSDQKGMAMQLLKKLGVDEANVKEKVEAVFGGDM